MVDCSGERVKLVLVIINSLSGTQPVSSVLEQLQIPTTATPTALLLFMTLLIAKALIMLRTGMKK